MWRRRGSAALPAHCPLCRATPPRRRYSARQATIPGRAVPSHPIGRVRCSVGIRKARGARPTPTFANRQQEIDARVRMMPRPQTPDSKSRARRWVGRDRHRLPRLCGAQDRAEMLPISLRCFLDPGPGIAKCHRAVEDEAPVLGVGIDAEVTQPHELVPGKRFCIRETGLYLAGGQNLP
jgi:hypothetical protein